MSWPDDNLPRFIVSTVHGHKIDPRTFTYSSGKRRIPVCAYVLDRAYAHRIVAAFERTYGNRFRDGHGTTLEAIAYAKELNRREEQVAA